MATAEEKLAQIASIVGGPTDVPAPTVPAYDRPPLVQGDPSIVADSVTFNSDGSLWTHSEPFGGGESAPVCIAFGYISPTKTPEIWQWAKDHMTPEGFQKFDSAWRANPYGVYRADPRDLINKGIVNIVSFAYLVQPFTTYHQA